MNRDTGLQQVDEMTVLGQATQNKRKDHADQDCGCNREKSHRNKAGRQCQWPCGPERFPQIPQDQCEADGKQKACNGEA